MNRKIGKTARIGIAIAVTLVMVLSGISLVFSTGAPPGGSGSTASPSAKVTTGSPYWGATITVSASTAATAYWQHFDLGTYSFSGATQVNLSTIEVYVGGDSQTTTVSSIAFYLSIDGINVSTSHAGFSVSSSYSDYELTWYANWTGATLTGDYQVYLNMTESYDTNNAIGSATMESGAASNALGVVADGNNAWTNATLTAQEYVPPQTYSVAINETGLTSGTTWSVYVNGTEYSSTSGTISGISLPNGTYSFSVVSVPGYTYSAPTSITVSGVPQVIGVTFRPVLYRLSIAESGLDNLTWAFSLAGTVYQLSNSSYNFSIANGTYSFSITSEPAGYSNNVSFSSVTVSGVNETVYVGFTLTNESTLYNATIALADTVPAGTSWSFTFNGTTYTQTNRSYAFFLPNGSYPVSTPLGYSLGVPVGDPLGEFYINGSGETLIVTETVISATLYSATVNEKGLPSGTSWGIAINGSKYYSSNGSITSISLPNGTYNYTAFSNSTAYKPVNGTGTVTIDGSPVLIGTISFVSTSVSGNKTGSGGGGSGSGAGPGGSTQLVHREVASFEIVFIILVSVALFAAALSEDDEHRRREEHEDEGSRRY